MLQLTKEQLNNLLTWAYCSGKANVQREYFNVAKIETINEIREIQ